MKHCVAAVLLLAVAAQAVHLDFAGGFNGWQHSDDAKYGGRFELATPEGLSSQALKVRHRLAHRSIKIALRRGKPPDQQPGGFTLH